MDIENIKLGDKVCITSTSVGVLDSKLGYDYAKPLFPGKDKFYGTVQGRDTSSYIEFGGGVNLLFRGPQGEAFLWWFPVTTILPASTILKTRRKFKI